MIELHTLKAAAVQLVKDLDAHGEHLTPEQIADLTGRLEGVMYEVWDSDPSSVTPIDGYRIDEAARADRLNWEQQVYENELRRGR